MCLSVCLSDDRAGNAESTRLLSGHDTMHLQDGSHGLCVGPHFHHPNGAVDPPAHFLGWLCCVGFGYLNRGFVLLIKLQLLIRFFTQFAPCCRPLYETRRVSQLISGPEECMFATIS